MSKASKWAALDPGEWSIEGGFIAVRPVNEWADESTQYLACAIDVDHPVQVTPAEAVSLGKWLIDTFGED